MDLEEATGMMAILTLALVVGVAAFAAARLRWPHLAGAAGVALALVGIGTAASIVAAWDLRVEPLALATAMLLGLVAGGAPAALRRKEVMWGAAFGALTLALAASYEWWMGVATLVALGIAMLVQRVARA